MDEIQISDEMLYAAEDAIAAELGGCTMDTGESFSPRQLAAVIYSAMERVRLSQIVPLVERVPICPGITVDAGTIFVPARARDPRDTITWKTKND